MRNDYSGDRYYDIYTFGDAQLYFDQSRYDDILDGIYGQFVSKNYLSGIRKFISECSNYYDRGYAPKFSHAYVDGDSFTLIIMAIMISKNKMVRKAMSASEYLNKDSVNYTVHTDQFTHSHTTHYTVSSSSGGGSHGGSSGGGHSSGGGRHG